MPDEKLKPGRGFTFLRHGETAANHNMICCGGDREMPMIDSGRQQVRNAAEVLRNYRLIPQLIITGDLQRTVESAQIIQNELNPVAEILIDQDLNERYLGDWNGQSQAVINPIMIAGETPNGGESRVEFRSRMNRSLNRQLKHFSNWPLVIGSRGNARILLEAIQDPDAAFFPNGRLLKVEIAEIGDFSVQNIERLERF